MPTRTGTKMIALQVPDDENFHDADKRIQEMLKVLEDTYVNSKTTPVCITYSMVAATVLFNLTHLENHPDVQDNVIRTIHEWVDEVARAVRTHHHGPGSAQ